MHEQIMHVCVTYWANEKRNAQAVIYELPRRNVANQDPNGQGDVLT